MKYEETWTTFPAILCKTTENLRMEFAFFYRILSFRILDNACSTLVESVVFSKIFIMFTDSNPDTLKAKKSELRLYCDLLMQQVHMVKTAVTEDGTPQVQVCISSHPTSDIQLFLLTIAPSSHLPDVSELLSSSSILSEDCNSSLSMNI